ncbi:tudor domain-containing protein qin [Dermatophagoides pteronyssinus]|uniref:Tudor domain-containing protein n=1 Tax=Dermatophagoides pteronyssinus TaxID=6956 RepID=A0ABQ8IZ98_DERPT|nr:hypothetical protein DERP_000105 [Dermatophagoides pteronyssinus]
MLSDLDLSCLLQETIPDTSNPNEKIPCIITKYLNYNEIFVQFKKYRDSLAKLSSDMHAYYCDKSWDEIVFIEKTSKAQWKNLFIYHDHHNDMYLRTKIIEKFADRKYHVLLLDLGYEYIADKDDLILSDNPDFLKLPIQGFKFGLEFDEASYKKIGNHPDKSKFNLAVQKIVLSSTDCWIAFSKDNARQKVDIYCKNNDEIIDIVNFIEQQMVSEANMVVTTSKHPNAPVELSNNHSQKDVDISEPIISSSSMMIAHPLLSESFAQFIMKVKMVTSPSDFYLKFIADPDYQKFKLKLKSFMTSDSIKKIDNPKIGHVYGAIADHHRNKYIRVYILSFNDVANEYNCFEMDKGMETFYKSSQLYEIPEELITFPARSVRASLYGITPKNDEIETTMELQQLICEQKAEVLTMEFDHDKNHLMCSLIVDDVNVGDYLIENGFANIIE